MGGKTKVVFEMIICKVCHGFGKVERRELVNYHKRDYAYWEEKCETCGGHGRLKQTTTIKVEKLTKQDLEISKRSE